MTHARHFSAGMMPVQQAAAVLDDGRFVASVSFAPSPIAATVAGFSIETTAWPSAGTHRCNTAPSDALAESSFRIPSANTPGFAAAALGVLSLACSAGLDFSDELTDLDGGSWEGSLPDSSSLGGDGTPLRGAFTVDLRVAGIPELHWRENSINFFGIGDFSSPSACGGLAHSGPPKWTTLSPPPTDYRYENF